VIEHVHFRWVEENAMLDIADEGVGPAVPQALDHVIKLPGTPIALAVLLTAKVERSGLTEVLQTCRSLGLTAARDPTLPSRAVQLVRSYPRYKGYDANVVAKSLRSRSRRSILTRQSWKPLTSWRCVRLGRRSHERRYMSASSACLPTAVTLMRSTLMVGPPTSRFGLHYNEPG